MDFKNAYDYALNAQEINPNIVKALSGKKTKIEPLTITKNGIYDGGEQLFDGYNPITVNVKPSVEPLTVTKNGEYLATKEGEISLVDKSVPIGGETAFLVFEGNFEDETPEGVLTFLKKKKLKINLTRASGESLSLLMKDVTMENFSESQPLPNGGYQHFISFPNEIELIVFSRSIGPFVAGIYAFGYSDPIISATGSWIKEAVDGYAPVSVQIPTFSTEISKNGIYKIADKTIIPSSQRVLMKKEVFIDKNTQEQSTTWRYDIEGIPHMSNFQDVVNFLKEKNISFKYVHASTGKEVKIYIDFDRLKRELVDTGHYEMVLGYGAAPLYGIDYLTQETYSITMLFNADVFKSAAEQMGQGGDIDKIKNGLTIEPENQSSEVIASKKDFILSYIPFDADLSIGASEINVDINPSILPLNITKNGTYNPDPVIKKRLRSEVIKYSELKGSFIKQFDAEISGPEGFTLDTAKSLLASKKIKIYDIDQGQEKELVPTRMLTKEDVQAGAANQAIFRGSHVLLCESASGTNAMIRFIYDSYEAISLDLDLKKEPKVGIEVPFLVSDDPASETDKRIEYEEESSIDGYGPITVNVEGRPIEKATEAELDAVVTNKTPETIGTCYIYTGTPGKYQNNKAYLLTDSGLV